MDGGRCTITRTMTEPLTPHTSSDWLLGSWHLLRCDATLELEPGTRMHFGAETELEYVIPTANGPLRVELRWRVEDDVLHTRLADGSNPVEVGVSLSEADVLTFDFGGPRAWFVRAT